MPLLLADKLRLFVELFVVTIAELLVSDSDTSRLDNNDLLVSDNFSVVCSATLLGGLAVAGVCSVAVTVLEVELKSDKSAAVVRKASVEASQSKPLVVVFSNEVVLESAENKKKPKGGWKFSLNFLGFLSRKKFFPETKFLRLFWVFKLEFHRNSEDLP